MNLHVYALTEPPAELPAAEGIDGARISSITVGEVDVVVSENAAVAPSEAAVLAHARVVEQLLERNETVLPVRFGTGFSDEHVLRTQIEERAAPFRDALERLRGRAEIGLRVNRPEAGESSAASSGTEYLAHRLAELQSARKLAEQIHGPLAARADAATENVLATPELLLSAAYLVAREQVEEFRADVERLAGEHEDLTFVCTGPWPPYSFATVEAGS